MSNYNKSLFEGVPKKNPNKSRFNLSHEYKAQINPGYLIPVMTEETLPGDEFTINSEFMFRFAPLYFPIMHKITMRADYYYIPNRILWLENPLELNPGWAKWITEPDNESQTPIVVSEQAFRTTEVNINVLGYMGIPLLHEDDVAPETDTIIDSLNALPLSAYLKIWDEYYRVTQLENPRWFPLENGDNSPAFETAFGTLAASRYYPLLSAKWEKDYFTSALPTPQIGEAVRIPAKTGIDDGAQILNTDGTIAANGPLAVDAGALEDSAGGASYVSQEGATIKELRLAEVLQSFYERVMKVGERYRDFMKGLWGLDPTPMAVDVPILLGSKFGRVQISDVSQTAIANLSGNAKAGRTGDYTGNANLYSNDNDEIRYECKEHGWIICILQLNPNTSYGQGIHRMWRRNIQTDYALDMFSGIGDQEILKEELLYNAWVGQESKNGETFGYIPRFSEYRYRNNIHIGTLNFTGGISQHLGRYYNPVTTEGALYDSTIEIDATFTNSQPGGLGGFPIELGGTRIVDTFRVLPDGTDAVLAQRPTESIIYAHIFHTLYVNRQLPMFSTPKIGL